MIARRIAALGLTAVLGCATQPAANYRPTTALLNDQRLSSFAPRPDGQDTTIVYDVLDEVLGGIVFVTGPSLRKAAARPPARDRHAHYSRAYLANSTRR